MDRVYIVTISLHCISVLLLFTYLILGIILGEKVQEINGVHYLD